MPALETENYNVAALYLRGNLSRLVESFINSEAFTNRQFRGECLDRLPPTEMAACAAAVGIPPSGRTFTDLRNTLARAPWTHDFANRFVAHFNLPTHFLP